MLSLYVRIGSWWTGLRDRAREEKGAAAVEYGLLVALIAAVIVVVVKALGTKVKTGFDTVNTNLP
ncbi:MAG: Flp family type IVb pilin [Acidobacteria bacterium]|nr:Flp family type IVb pilin [Acidobacteriota bacterium]